MQHIITNSKRWDYSDIPGDGQKYIKRPAHMVEGDQINKYTSNPLFATMPSRGRQLFIVLTHWTTVLPLLPTNQPTNQRAPRQWTSTTTRWRCGPVLLPSLTLRSLHPQGHQSPGGDTGMFIDTGCLGVGAVVKWASCLNQAECSPHIKSPTWKDI